MMRQLAGNRQRLQGMASLKRIISDEIIHYAITNLEFWDELEMTKRTDFPHPWL